MYTVHWQKYRGLYVHSTLAKIQGTICTQYTGKNTGDYMHTVHWQKYRGLNCTLYRVPVHWQKYRGLYFKYSTLAKIQGTILYNVYIQYCSMYTVYI